MKSIQLSRTFTESSRPSNDEEDWSSFHDPEGGGGLAWADLKDKPVTVVLGEAGTGKTVELSLQAERLRKSGQAAFVLALNQLQDQGSWELTLGHDGLAEYEHWLQSSDNATFFLDAIDESRLLSHTDFDRALAVVQNRLCVCFERVSFVLSSRPSDWRINEVRDSLRMRLCRPLASALESSKRQELSPTVGVSPEPNQRAPVAEVDPFAVSLDPLSITEAQRLADFFGVREPLLFWAAVAAGGYEFMACRPRDLQWLVDFWKNETELGIFRDLLENSAVNRLKEWNQNYIKAQVSRSPSELRDAVERLAAASELSGRGYVALEPVGTSRKSEVMASDVLDDWKTDEVNQLLATAIFDEASYGRVRFHDRTTRAYLAACWASGQLEKGVPLSQITGLFCSAPFGSEVLIPNRRWTLCWLAAIQPKVREWVANRYPEMLMFDGDPQAWDQPTAERAFIATVDALDKGRVHNWRNSGAEYRRLGLRLSPGLVARILLERKHSLSAQYLVHAVARYARLQDCADLIFEAYRNPNTSPHERTYALFALETLASQDMQSAIRDDLVSGLISRDEQTPSALKDEQIASALVCSNWQRLLPAALSAILSHAGSQSGSLMSSTIRVDLLPKTSAASAELLVSAVLAALPVPVSAKRFSRNQEFELPARTWLLEVLPDCFEKLLNLLSPSARSQPDVCLAAAERLEALHGSLFVNTDDFLRVRIAIEKHPALRWGIALEIAQSVDLTKSIQRLTSGVDCIVSFGAADTDALVEKANDVAADQSVRNVWFLLACDIAIRTMKGRGRGRVLNLLCQGLEAIPRREKIEVESQRRRNDFKARREWNSKKFARKRDEALKLDRYRQQLVGDVDGIRAGTSPIRIQELVYFSYERSDRRSFSHVEYEVIAATFGAPVAEALQQGLHVLSETTEPPDASEYQNGSCPWPVILALAGCDARLRDHDDMEALTPQFVARAARLAVWERSAVPEWFAVLVKWHPSVVAKSLAPWIEADAVLDPASSAMPSALRLALRCTPLVRAVLLKPLKPIAANHAVRSTAMLKNMLSAMKDDAVLSIDEVNAEYKARVQADVSAVGSIQATLWLRAWLEAHAAAAVGWMEGHSKRYPSAASENAIEFARAAADFKSIISFDAEFKWMRLPASDADVSALEALDLLLPRYRPNEGDVLGGHDLGQVGEPLVGEVRRAIVRTLVCTPGIVARRALTAMVTRETHASALVDIEAQVVEHASREAALRNNQPVDIKRLARPFAFMPRTEAELFVQVMGRLQEIKLQTEKGPFSDRALFHLELRESALQNWLASKLFDHPNRHYSVAPNELVDNDKMPDIQAAVAAGKVCIEIKPLSRKHSYSAASLVETLRTQIGEQYLRGLNSRHGVLVLFRLDDKKWKIPGVSGLGLYEDLAAYLQLQADNLRESEGHIDALQVLLIDCVPPAKR